MSDNDFSCNREKARSLYSEGRYSELFSFLKKTAKTGDPVAMRDLGWSYFKGDGGEANLDKAMEWFQRSAEKGDAGAHYGIGSIYFSNKEYIEALKFFEMSASMEWPVACRWAGMMYENGMGAEKDLDRAELYYRKAADLKNVKAKRLLAKLYIQGRHGVFGRVAGYLSVAIVFFQAFYIALKDENDMRLR